MDARGRRMKNRNVSLVLSIGLALLIVAATMVCLNRPSSFASPDQSLGGDDIPVITVCLDGGCDYDTIQDAVDAAEEGAVIKVAAGTYAGVESRPAPDQYPYATVITQVVYVDKGVTLQGGYAVTNWITPDLEANPTLLDAQGRGRGLFIAGPTITPTIVGLRITGGDAAGLRGHPGFPDTDAGGGAYVFSSPATITATQLFSNTADWGGGVYVYQSDATLSNNAVFSNTTSRFFGPGAFHGGGLYLYESDAELVGNAITSNTAGSGGGLHLHRSHAVLTDNAIISNTAEWYGGGLRLEHSDVKLGQNVVHGNAAQFGGGLYLLYSDAELDGNAITGNAAHQSHGGGLYLQRSDAVITGNLIISNTAASFGGGVHLYLRSDAVLVNNVVADNRADVAGGALYVWRSIPRLLHTTVARNRGGDGSGIFVRNEGQPRSTVQLTNTVIVSHRVGISVAAGSDVALNGVLWDSDTMTHVSRSPTDTAVAMQNQYTGDPAFAPDGYHLLPSSEAIDKGVDAGIDVDIDGEPRPRGAAPDLGADEQGPILFAGFEHSAPHWLGEPTVFTNTTVVSGPVSYRWDFGDGGSSTAVSPTHTYTAPGTYTVVLTATGGELQDVATGRVVIYAASFTSSSPDWVGQTTAFTNTSLAGPDAGYAWSFGDGVTGTQEHPTHTYGSPALYTVALTVTNDVGLGVATDTVALYGPPHVDFVGRPRQGLAPLPVAFMSIVTTTPPGDPSLRYLWHVAVGHEEDATSTLPATDHTYVSTGVYTVSLRVTNALTSAVAVKPAYITVRDTLEIYLPLIARDS